MATSDAGQASDSGSDTRIPEASTAVLEALYAENRASAARLRACHRLHAICEDAQFEKMIAAGYDPEFDDERSYAVVDPHDIASSEIVAAYGIHVHRARSILTLALDLVNKYPAIIGAMETGRLDERTAEMLAKQMRTVDAASRHAVQKDVIDWLLSTIESGSRPSRSAILAKTDRFIEKHDPEGVLYRRREALSKRYVSVKRSADGMSTLRANLASTEAESIYSALQSAARERMETEREALAEAVRHLGKHNVDFTAGRTMEQHRADALVDAMIGPGSTTSTGADAGAGADADAGAGAGAAAGTETDTVTDAEHAPTLGPGGRLSTQLRPYITVLTSLGPNGEPEVYLPRGGVATIDALIALLTRSIGATISLPDPEPGSADSPQAERRYRIGAELARRIRLRDGTCRHPGCSVPAEDCDIDHVRPFSHINPDSGGLTVEANLMCLCRRHHRFKTFHDWQYQLERDGTLTVTTSTGHTLSTSPEGPLARWRQKSPSNSESVGDLDDWSGLIPGANPPPLRDEPEPTHWHQRAQRLLAERQANSAARHAPKIDDALPPF